MIAYRITLNDLEDLIELHVPGWLKRAALRTTGFRNTGRYQEKSSIWSEVKVVYMRLQGDSKCAYCERKLESIDFGKVEQDVEHFRPKGRVRAWKVPKALSDEGIAFTASPTSDYGYYLLPYHPFNYSAACKPCNSVLKRDHFPIAGRYDLKGRNPVRMTKEKPLLICPVGDFDDSPEDLIGFHGVSPQAKALRGHDRSRALVTIEFFKLDDEVKRKNLIRERALIILALYPQLTMAVGPAGPDKTEAQRLIRGFTAANAPHSNCARSYEELFVRDAAEARTVFQRASELIMSSS